MIFVAWSVCAVSEDRAFFGRYLPVNDDTSCSGYSISFEICLFESTQPVDLSHFHPRRKFLTLRALGGIDEEERDHVCDEPRALDPPVRRTGKASKPVDLNAEPVVQHQRPVGMMRKVGHG